MSWMDKNYPRRWSMTVDNVAGAAGGGKDVEIGFPSAWDLFWGTSTGIQSTGYDIRVTQADGVTPVAFARKAGFSYATKTLTLQLDGVTLGAAKPCSFWVYWGYAAAADGAVAVVIAAPLTGYVEVFAPTADRVIKYRPERLGDTTPAQGFQKTSGETIDVYVDFAAGLAARITPEQDQLVGTEIDYFTVSVSLAGVADAGMFDESKGRIVGTAVKCRLAAGTSGNAYLVTVTAVTTGNAATPALTLVQYFQLKVQNVTP